MTRKSELFSLREVLKHGKFKLSRRTFQTLSGKEVNRMKQILLSIFLLVLMLSEAQAQYLRLDSSLTISSPATFDSVKIRSHGRLTAVAEIDRHRARLAPGFEFQQRARSPPQVQA